MELNHIKHIGIAAALKGGRVLYDYLGNICHINKKGPLDLVTEADTGSEKEILKIICSHFPDHSILAEESGANQVKSDYQWIIDPLDGTTNFAHQVPFFSVSIAFAIKGNIAAGIVFNPVTRELFTAVQGQGAELNGRAIKVSASQNLSESLLVTGFPYNFKEIFDLVISRFSRCLKASQGVRRLGSASLDLCYVACGRFDGFWEQNLKPWDTGAGFLIAKEAGAVITDFSGNPFSINMNEILASNGNIHKEMISLLQIEDI
ncbi:Inositol-1-monophosphatase [Desulfonema limicola]|uniref:Inositol-1-monophosphatase n=1 Tax=Desulfonema limicola TaxID=45656 RepID=A0A975GGK3_9BACT|nr:inositol monophosphatase family protein [Desulfonema limicola]QTA80354.1 Inositol-1-monophosphatase [Desulfonema limicola]